MVFATPLKLTTEAVTKFVPLTVSVNWEDPATVEVGEMEVVVGTGLFMFAVVVG